jgi:hypothetical protein
MFNPATPFPVIDFAAEIAPWPRPPFAWPHTGKGSDEPQPCVIETTWREKIEGQMILFDTSASLMKLHLSKSLVAAVPFSRLCMLTLKEPLVANNPVGLGKERLPFADHERKYRFEGSDGQLRSGYTVGYVINESGLFLFEPTDDEESLLRVFVPTAAYSSLELGPSESETALRRWITTREELIEAIEKQKHSAPLRIGEALLNLGLVTRRQLEHALAKQRGEQALGEMLLASGAISGEDLDAALAHKMGFPLVDMRSFPIDDRAVKMLGLQVAVAAEAVPLMLQDDILVVAVDHPSRMAKLKTIQTVTGKNLVPALSSKVQITQALTNLQRQHVSVDNVVARVVFPRRTIFGADQ